MDLIRHRAPDGGIVVQLPQLSRYKLLSRPACDAPLREILELDVA